MFEFLRCFKLFELIIAEVRLAGTCGHDEGVIGRDGDEIADGLFIPNADGDRPLALFDGLRTDFSLARLKHYTGTPADHVQRYILFTNYHRYVDEFVAWACTELTREGTRFTALSGAGGVYVTPETADPARMIADSLFTAITMRRDGLSGGRAGKDLPYV